MHDAHPDKDAWFTECSGGEWAPKWGDNLTWFTRTLVIGATRGWAKGVLFWNLALDEKHGPHAGGCGDCRGVVTIESASGAVTLNEEYYALGHASRFVRPGAYRTSTTKDGDGVEAASFANPDGSRIAILYRKSGSGPATIALDGERYSVALPVGSVATLRWGARSGGR